MNDKKLVLSPTRLSFPLVPDVLGSRDSPSSTPQEAASSSIVGKVIKIGVMVTVGLGIASVIDLIKSDTGAGKKKCPMDQETKDKLDLVLNALDGVTGIACKAFLGRCYCCCLFLCYVCSMLLLLLLLLIIIIL